MPIYEYEHEGEGCRLGKVFELKQSLYAAKFYAFADLGGPAGGEQTGGSSGYGPETGCAFLSATRECPEWSPPACCRSSAERSAA